MTCRAALAFTAVATLAAGCSGDNKNYGDPIEGPEVQQHAAAAIQNTQGLAVWTDANAPLAALSGLSANYNVLAGIKLQELEGRSARQALAAAADEHCADRRDTEIVYDACSFGGNLVTGSLARDGADFSIDLSFREAEPDPDFSMETEARGGLSITESALDGFMHFRVEVDTQDQSITASLNGDFSIDLDASGCAVDGELEIHSTARAGGQRQSVWVKAEYGPTCDDIVVR